MPTAAVSETEPRPRDADATRAALLQAAMRRFTLLGYDRTTTRDIAQDAGVNVSLIARYFGSKDGLFGAVLRESAQAMGQGRTTGDLDLVGSVLDGLRTDTWPEFGGEHPLLMILRDSGESEEIAALRRRALTVAVDHLGTLVASERPAPPGRGRHAEQRLRAETVLALLTGMLSVRAAIPDGALATATPARLDTLVRTLVDALAPPGA
jgi:AcrR family transcriptional regulator